jgi:hypothetical protein
VSGWAPGKIVEEDFALLAVEAFRVVRAFTTPVHLELNMQQHFIWRVQAMYSWWSDRDEIVISSPHEWKERKEGTVYNPWKLLIQQSEYNACIVVYEQTYGCPVALKDARVSLFCGTHKIL